MTQSIEKRRFDAGESPWGRIDRKELIADGVWFISTPSHGGYFLSNDRLGAISADLSETFAGRGRVGWFEEDCDWAVVALTFPELFPAGALELARNIAKHFHPRWLAS